ncbi:hypothetical protein [Pseudomonas phage D6]|nr:hypothetical protein [Pseudomonas phage D6]
MKWLAVLAAAALLTGCDPRKADFITDGKLVGSSCKTVIVQIRYEAPRETLGECLVAVKTATGETRTFATGANYKEMIGKEVTVIQVKEDEYRILERIE